MSSLVQSADLNPIEMVSDGLDSKVRNKQPTSADYFCQLLQETWAEKSSVYLQSLVERSENL